MIKWSFPGLWSQSLVSPIALWGKMPCRGDFIRHNLPYEQEEALQIWVSQKRKILSPIAQEIPRRMVTQGIPWHSLEPRAASPRAQSVDPQPAQPWSFILPPESLPFATDRYLIGVWMNSSDKVGREYPLIMSQTATRRWVKSYFAQHTKQPCEWLFHAACIIANSIHVQEDEADRPTDRNRETNHIAILLAQLDALWTFYTPNRRHFMRKRVQLPGKAEARQIQQVVGSPHPDDPARHLEGVRFLPWANWPESVLNPATQGHFWQQDLNGRFIGAIQD